MPTNPTISELAGDIKRNGWAAGVERGDVSPHFMMGFLAGYSRIHQVAPFLPTSRVNIIGRSAREIRPRKPAAAYYEKSSGPVIEVFGYTPAEAANVLAQQQFGNNFHTIAPDIDLGGLEKLFGTEFCDRVIELLVTRGIHTGAHEPVHRADHWLSAFPTEGWYLRASLDPQNEFPEMSAYFPETYSDVAERLSFLGPFAVESGREALAYAVEAGLARGSDHPVSLTAVERIKELFGPQGIFRPNVAKRPAVASHPIGNLAVRAYSHVSHWEEFPFSYDDTFYVQTSNGRRYRIEFFDNSARELPLEWEQSSPIPIVTDRRGRYRKRAVGQKYCARIIDVNKSIRNGALEYFFVPADNLLILRDRPLELVTLTADGYINPCLIGELGRHSDDLVDQIAVVACRQTNPRRVGWSVEEDLPARIDRDLFLLVHSSWDVLTPIGKQGFEIQLHSRGKDFILWDGPHGLDFNYSEAGLVLASGREIEFCAGEGKTFVNIRSRQRAANGKSNRRLIVDTEGLCVVGPYENYPGCLTVGRPVTVSSKTPAFSVTSKLSWAYGTFTPPFTREIRDSFAAQHAAPAFIVEPRGIGRI